MSSNKARQFAIERAAGRSTRTAIRVSPGPVASVAPQKKPCGCDKRKAWLNSVIPGAGDAVEWVTTKTGIKRLVQGAEE